MEHTNIILINVDDMGYSDLGCYGSSLNKTPNIDKLAEDGMRFTDFYAAAPLCTPSRGGMMTGSYPKRIDFAKFNIYDFNDEEHIFQTHGVLFPGQPEGLNPSERTIASVLKEAGYRTKIIGKWHLGDQPEFSPLNYGFDEYLGLPYSNDMGLSPDFGAWSKHPKLEHVPLPLMEGNEVIEEQPDTSYITELYTNTAVKFIRENKDNPFFLYFAHMYVHFPLYPRERFMKESKNGRMGAALAEVDWSVAAIVYELERLGLTDDTLILLVSDNGGGKHSQNLPLRGFKATCWEGGQRVNCIARWPNKISPGSISNSITSMLDFMPTFAEIADVELDDGVIRDGFSMMPHFINPETAESQYEAFYYYDQDVLTAIRIGDFKYHVLSGELYNLRSDIGESNNVADDNTEMVKTFIRYAEQARKDMGDGEIAGENCRAKGFVKNSKPLAYYDKNKPYIIPLYDLYD